MRYGVGPASSGARDPGWRRVTGSAGLGKVKLIWARTFHKMDAGRQAELTYSTGGEGTEA